MPNPAYDLHIHSCLSPCGDDEMTPANIVGMAAVKELELIAVTDHSSCKNCGAVLRLAEEYGVLAVPGMELTTAEEVHVVCLFEDLHAAMDFDEYVYSKLPDIANVEKIFGKQQIMDEEETVTGTVEKLLINATSISFDDVYGLVEERGGVMIPAHLDKSTTSLISNLGFIPPDAKFVTAEVKNFGNLHRLAKEHPYLEKCRILSNSDAHYLQDIHEPEHTLYVEEMTRRAVIRALKQGVPHIL
ncbi:MAG: phosphoesterase [Lachnospiraceae bacterium]|nr:phosphoesterase [Lachnospiraceae bacterium]